MKYQLPPLAYSYEALEPYIDARTMEIHHTKHHQAYIDNLNKALEKHPELSDKSLKELITDLDKVPEEIRAAVRNHGGGHLNHSMFWETMTPDSGKNEFKDKVAEMILSEFESFEKFKECFTDLALKRFGSGWIWLVIGEDKKLEIMSTANQDSPLMENKSPILCLDLWEHAYYLKYQNKRADYISAWWNAVNWSKVNENYLLSI